MESTGREWRKLFELISRITTTAEERWEGNVARIHKTRIVMKFNV
jgi:hypothetical protein